MSDTPRTDALLISSDGIPDMPDEKYIVAFCRQLERELAAANALYHNEVENHHATREELAAANARADDFASQLSFAVIALDKERKAREIVESTIASLQDTVAAAHRNSGLPNPDIRHDTDLREDIWQLSYSSNEYKQRAEAAEARVKELERKLGNETLAHNATLRKVAEVRAAERTVEELKTDLAHIAEYWNGNENITAMKDACNHVIEVAQAAIAKQEQEKP